MMLFRKWIIGVRVLALAGAVTAVMPLWQSGTAQAQVSIGISVNFAPPALPVYEQPLCPGEGYMWTPGYWAWDPDYGDYYWVPGTWVLAPQPGYLWTPPYWGWNGVAFIFHEGYWGPHIGFYGGINYGWGYPGRGYYGGRWERDRFYYNRSVNNINVTQIHNVYNKTVINNVNVTRVSYNGGNGGVRDRANRQEEAAFRDRHVGAVAAQQQHIQEARSDRGLRASDNRGKPPIAATDRPGQFRGGTVVAAKEGRYNPPANRGGGNRPDNRVEGNRPETRNDRNDRNDRSDRPPSARGPENNNRPTYTHPNDVPKTNRPDRPPSSGNAKADQKYNQRSDNMYKKQEQERQNLQKKQDQQHARAEQQRQNDARRQQMENQHQQQTQKMEQRQQQQQQKMERQAPKPRPQSQPKQQPPKQQGEKPHGKGR